ncbi:MAG: F0F1 ATP synthase subunit B [Thermoanaerobaculia bacterium]
MKTESKLQRLFARATVVAGFAMMAALPAFAEEHAEAPGGPFEGNFGVALWTLIIFGLVIFVLGRFAWGPILGGLQEREKFIRESIESAKRDREAAEARLKEYSEKLLTARTEASAIVEEARRDAEALKRTFLEESQAEANRILERARREIKIAQETGVKELYILTATLATQVASKVLQREIQPSDHERLIQDSIRALVEGKGN